MTISLNPSQLTGPRSYFTDLDPKDWQADTTLIQRKLKLQLLTKKNIVIAASSMFHRDGFNFFKRDEGLVQALQEGIFLPAIRDEFEGISGFFDSKKSNEFSVEALTFFSGNTASFVKWSLHENTTWFHQKLIDSIAAPLAPVRLYAKLTPEEQDKLQQEIDLRILAKPSDQRFLNRDDVVDAAKFLSKENQTYINGLTNFLYRLSGARVVNSEGHFPQSDLTPVPVVGNEQLLSEQRIFWDLYVEAIFSYLTKATRLSCERIDQLSFSDIIKIREDLFDVDFADTYDKLLALAKSEINLLDPDQLLMTQDEIFSIASRLELLLSQRIKSESIHTKDNSKVLAQIGSVVEKAGDYTVFGAISAAKSIPAITTYLSPKLGKAFSQRIYAIKRFTESRLDWNPRQKTALLAGYSRLINYGQPELV